MSFEEHLNDIGINLSLLNRAIVVLICYILSLNMHSQSITAKKRICVVSNCGTIQCFGRPQ